MRTLIQASSSADLHYQLAQMDITVLPRAEGRTKDQTERFSIAHLIASLPSDYFAFPLTLGHGDRPDCSIAFNGKTVGVEVTEAVPENMAHASVLRQSGIGPAVYFVPHAVPGEAKKTALALRREIELDRGGSPWMGDEPEREWTAAMLHFTLAKVQKAHNEGFALHSSNWLLIYDNWPLPHVRLADASAAFAAKCTEAKVFSTFERVFVLASRTLCEFGSEVRVHAVSKPNVE